MIVVNAASLLHLVLHAAVPLAVACLIDRAHWRRAWMLLLAGWVIDLDHLLAEPMYAPDRCSIGFHPLHTAPAIGAYVAILVPARTRMLAIGLLIHIGLDAIDCWRMACA